MRGITVKSPVAGTVAAAAAAAASAIAAAAAMPCSIAAAVLSPIAAAALLSSTVRSATRGVLAGRLLFDKFWAAAAAATALAEGHPGELGPKSTQGGPVTTQLHAAFFPALSTTTICERLKGYLAFDASVVILT